MTKIIVNIPEKEGEVALDGATALEFVAAVIRSGRADEDYADTQFLKYGPNHATVLIVGEPVGEDVQEVLVSTHRNKSSDSFTVEGFGPHLDESYKVRNPHRPTDSCGDIPLCMLPPQAKTTPPPVPERDDADLKDGILKGPYTSPSPDKESIGALFLLFVGTCLGMAIMSVILTA